MGYSINMIDSSFVIKKENFEKALESLKKVFVPENMTCHDSSGSHFSWVSTEIVLKSETIEEALKGIRYLPKQDSDGNICDIEFMGENDGDEKIFFNALAPFVETNSYLTFKGEDGVTWKWLFTNGKVKYK